MTAARQLNDEIEARSVAYADASGRIIEKHGTLSNWMRIGECLTDSNAALIGQEDAFDALKDDPEQRFTRTDISFSDTDQRRFHTIVVRWLPEQDCFEVCTTCIEAEDHSALTATPEARNQHHTDQQLEQERAHFRRIYERSPQLAICISRSGTVVAASHSLRERFLTDECMASDAPLTAVLVGSALWQALWQGSDVSSMPVRAFDTDGRRCDLEVSGIAAQHPNAMREEAYFTLIDITERNAARIELMDRSFELEQLSQRLQDSNKKLDQFASVAAHDLLAPLRRIAAFADMLSEEIEGDQGDAVSYALNAIRRSAQNGQRLVDDILQLSRISTVDSHIESICLNGIFTEVASEFDYKISEIGGRIAVDSADIPVVGDTRLAKLIFRNLITNAIKYRHGSRLLEVVLSQMTTGTPHARIDIADNGIGMEPEHAQRIFDPFVRLTDNADIQGHGLGLAIAHEAASAMGWHVCAHAEPGNGTRMVITAPIADQV